MQIWSVVLVTVLFHIGTNAARLTNALYALHLGATPFDIGMLIAVYSLAPLLFAVKVGRLSDQLGFRTPMLIGIVGMTAGMILPPLWPSLATVYLCSALVGSGFMFLHVSVQSLAGLLGSGESRTRNMSNLALGYAISSMIGPFLAGLSIDAFGHPRTYVWMIALEVLAAAVIAGSAVFARRAPRAADGAAQPSVLDLWKAPALRQAMIVNGLTTAGWDLYTFYLPVHGHAIGLSASAIGMVLSAFAMATLVVRIALPAIARRIGETETLTRAVWMSASLFLLLPFFRDPIALALLSFAIGLGLGCGQPLTMLLIYNHSPKGRTGEAMGLRIMVNNLTNTVVPLAFGLVGTAFGVIPVFWANALILGATGWLNRRPADVDRAA